MVYGTIRLLYGQCIGKRNFLFYIIIVVVIHLCITDFLDLRILGGINRQPAAVQCLISLCF